MKTLTRLLFLILCLLAAGEIYAPAQAAVVLNEVMYDPWGDDKFDEFIEIFNTSWTDTVDLAGWKIGDQDKLDPIVDAGEGLMLEPRQYGLILERDYYDSSATYDPLPSRTLLLKIDSGTLGGSGLRNTAPPDTVILVNVQGDTVMSYAYSIGNPQGRSDEKINPVGGGDPSNWKDSVVDNGSPGSPNSLTIKAPDVSVIKGGSVAVNITVQDASDLFEVDFVIRFNSSVVNFESVSVGDFLKQGDVQVHLLHTTTDTSVKVSVGRLGHRVSGALGSGTLATLDFQAVGGKDASTNLSFENVKPRDSSPNLNLIPAALDSGSISITVLNVIDTLPNNSVVNVINTAPIIRATFDQTPVSTPSTSTFLLSNGGVVSGTVSYDAPSRTATFSLSDTLVSDTMYTARLKESLGLESDYTWSFTASVMGDIFDLDDPTDKDPNDDYIGDGYVDGDDLAVLGFFYGLTSDSLFWSPLPDFNRDNKVDSNDLAILGSNYGRKGINFSPSPKPIVKTLRGSKPTLNLIYDSGMILEGQEVEATIEAEGVVELYALNLELLFDGEALEMVRMEGGDLLGEGPDVAFVSRLTEGSLIVGATRLGRIGGVSGDGRVIKVSFRAKRDGFVDMALSNVVLVNSELELIGAPVVEGAVSLPAEFVLFQNYPNPFNATTVIRYQLPKSSEVTLKIYDLLGQEVRTLVEGSRAAGSYQLIWGGKNGQGEDMSSGVYLLYLRAGGYSCIKKMLLVR